MKTIFLDDSCVGTVISEHPYVKLLTVPKPIGQLHLWGPQWCRAVAQVDGMLATIEVKITP